MNEAGEKMRTALVNKRIAEIVADPDRVTRMSWEVKAHMLKGEALSEKLVAMLTASPTVPYDLDDFVLVGLLGSALNWKADKITFKTFEGGYTAFFYRRTPWWLRWAIAYYPWGGTKSYVTITRMTIDLSACSLDSDKQ